jgi:hypothetical protein
MLHKALKKAGPEAMFRHACALGLEGTISKRVVAGRSARPARRASTRRCLTQIVWPTAMPVPRAHGDEFRTLVSLDHANSWVWLIHHDLGARHRCGTRHALAPRIQRHGSSDNYWICQ